MMAAAVRSPVPLCHATDCVRFDIGYALRKAISLVCIDATANILAIEQDAAIEPDERYPSLLNELIQKTY
jgi:hypothetical protein